MKFTDIEKDKISFALDLLNGITNEDYKFLSLNVKDDCIIFSDGKDEIKKSISELKNMKNDFSETSEMIVSENDKVQKGGNNQINFSETSTINSMRMDTNFSETSDVVLNNSKMIGGMSKNVFQKSKYSDTSSLAMSDVSISNNSKTSSATFNARSDKYSDTSIIGQVGGRANETTDTLMGVSELKNRKTKQINLDMGIFRKVQLGGSVDHNIKRKMMDMGINSNSSTSSICE